MRGLALVPIVVLLGCGSSASRVDAGASPDAGLPPDLGVPPDAPAVDEPTSVDVAQGRNNAADRSAFGACELLVGFVHVRTADGKATIARAEATGCQGQGGPCWPGDGGAGGPCATLDLVGYGGPCDLTLTSTKGQTFHQEAQPVIQSTGSYCEVDQEPGRLVEIVSLRYVPPEFVVSFARDGGADAAP